MFEHLNRLLKLAEPLGQLATEAVTAAAPLLDLAPERLAEANLTGLPITPTGATMHLRLTRLAQGE